MTAWVLLPGSDRRRQRDIPARDRPISTRAELILEAYEWCHVGARRLPAGY